MGGTRYNPPMTSAPLPDAPTNWVDRHAPEGLKPWLKLGRFDRPIGIWLLLLPRWLLLLPRWLLFVIHIIAIVLRLLDVLPVSRGRKFRLAQGLGGDAAQRLHHLSPTSFHLNTAKEWDGREGGNVGDCVALCLLDVCQGPDVVAPWLPRLAI